LKSSGLRLRPRLRLRDRQSGGLFADQIDVAWTFPYHGENVYPREVEEFLYRHPDIADVQVIGVPDEKYGEELMAWVIMREGAEPLTAEAVREFCRGRLAHFKIPRYVHVADSFPMTVTGKIRKVEMRERSVDMLGLQAVAQIRNA
jgi:fatty-acyl-CoA synthase